MRGRIFVPFRGLASSTGSDVVRVRFAPSPTGQLHLGGFRTALYNYLFAKAGRGSFVLRIEDTDQTRLVPGAEAKLESMLDWMGIRPDEGPSSGGSFGPYRQSERRGLHAEQVKVLLNNGSAYPCFCSEKRLDLMRREAARTRSQSKYDGRCRDLSSQEVQDNIGRGRPHTIRFKLRPGVKEFRDLVFGPYSHDVAEIEGDPIIIKSDGFPTYHFANVVDDHFMSITHVLRGVEWQVSTPKHLLIYEAFGWTPPEFGHLPLIMNSDGTKLSKRQQDTHLEYYRDSGFAPEGLLNFVSLVGGGFAGRDHNPDVSYGLEDFVRMFQVQKISTQSVRLEFDRLLRCNRAAIKAMLQSPASQTILLDQIQSLLREKGHDVSRYDRDYLVKLLSWSADRIHVLKELVAPQYDFLWCMPKSLPIKDDMSEQILSDAILIMEAKDEFPNAQEISQDLRDYCKQKSFKMPALMKVLRASITGSAQGVPIGELVEILGTREVIARLKNAKRMVTEEKKGL